MPLNYPSYIKALCIAMALLFSVSSTGQDEVTTVGTDFWFGFLSNFENDSDGLFIFLSSNQEAEVNVSMPFYGISDDYTVTPGAVTTVEIPDLAEHTQSEVVEDKGVHIVSDVPISAYCINFQGFTADGTRLLPTRFLGTNYMAMGYVGLLSYNSEFLIVATEDGTEVEITPACDLLNGSPEGVPFTIQLDQGETYQAQAANSSLDITGTTIQATEASGDCRPFAVFGGSECPNIPVGCTACDHVFDQHLPLDIWDTEYLLTPWLGTTSYTARVVASVDGTEVLLDGIPEATLDAGDFIELNDIDQAYYVTTSEPTYVVQYLEGTSCAGSGDPAMCSINGNDQVLENITFATVVSGVIDQHSLTVIVPTTAIANVFFDGTAIDPSEFTPYDALPDRSYARLEITEGSHTISCEEGFIAYSYGTGDAESYAYPTGAGRVDPPEEIIEGICAGGEVVLTGEFDYFSEWWTTQSEPEDTLSTEETLVITPPIETNIYVLNGFDFVSGCLSQEFFSVESTEPLAVDIPEDTVELCLFQSYQFEPGVSPESPAYTYDWTIPAAFVEPEAQNGVIEPFQSGYYFLDVSTLNECAIGSDSVYVDIIGGDAALQAINVLPEVVCFGDTVFLSADVISILGFESFDQGLGGLMSSAAGADFSDDCGAYGEAALLFNGNDNRFANTNGLDVSLGGTISFSLLISDGGSGCDAADPGEDVVLEYTLNGVDWFEIQTYIESGYPELTDLSIAIPGAAWSPNTIFRWIQPVFSGPGEDVWVLDNVFITSNSAPDAQYIWSSSQVIDAPNAQNTFSVPNANSSYTLVLGTDACQFTATAPIQVDADIQIQGPNLICIGDEVDLEVEGTFESVEWSTGESGNSITVDEGGTYSVDVFSLAGCEFEDELSISAIQAPSDLMTDTIICLDPTPLQLVPSQIWVDDYSWNTSDTTSIIEVDQSGVFVATLTNQCFTVIDSVSVEYVELPQDNLEELYEICLGDSLLLSIPSGSASILWSNGSTSDTAVFFIAGDIDVVLEELGCVYEEESVIEYIDYYDTDSLEIPNVFTPNDDGTNDVFQPYLPGTENSRVCILETFDADIQIFNRWGNLLQSTGCRWDGTSSSGEIVNEGTYFYIIEMQSTCLSRQSSSTRKGTVQVLK